MRRWRCWGATMIATPGWASCCVIERRPSSWTRSRIAACLSEVYGPSIPGQSSSSGSSGRTGRACSISGIDWVTVS